MRPLGIRYSSYAYNQLLALPDSTFERVCHSIEMLATNPGLSKPYEQTYEIGTQLTNYRWYQVPATPVIIMLTIDETTGTLACLDLLDARSDPLHGFLPLRWMDEL